MLANSASDVSTAGFFRWLPALFTRMSSGPNRASTSSTSAGMVESSVMSCRMYCAASRKSAHACFNSASRRPVMTTRAPASARARQMPRPRPVPPPVTSASFPSRRNASRVISLGLDHGHRRPHVSERKSHAGMPRRGAGHLRRVIGDDHAAVAVALEDPEHPDHVNVALIDENFVVPRHLALDVPEVNVADLALAAVPVDRFVDVARGHLGNRADAQLDAVAAAGLEVQHPLVVI